MTSTTNDQRASGVPVGEDLSDSDHKARIWQELIEAGVTRFGRRKFNSHYVHSIIHPDEHIMGVVYGRYGTDGFLRMNEGMLIATDRRVIFLDYKPGHMDMEEFTYNVVSGVKRLTAGPFSSVTLYTRLGNYTLRYSNPSCVERFMHFIEGRRLETER